MAEEQFGSQNPVALEEKKPLSVKKGHNCSICQKWFKRSGDLRRHCSVHSEERPISCDHCDLKFKSKDGLYQHLNYHSLDASLECEFCQKSFKLVANLKIHYRLYHTKERPYKCEMCNKSFPERSYLRYHYGSRTYLQHHRQFEEFKQFEYLVEKHEPVYGVYTCTVCNKSFKTKQRLRVHSEIHTAEKIECDICGFKVIKRYIKRHKISAHSNNRKLYFCIICQKSFSCKYKLNIHKAAKHEQNRPFKCEICSRAFAEKAALNTHIRGIHYGERNHACVLCDKKYKTTGGLKYHMIGHTGERPYVCHICDRSFKGSKEFNRHIKRCEEKKIMLESKKSLDSNKVVTVPKTESVDIKIESAVSEKASTQESFGHFLSKSLSAAKEAFNDGNNVFVSKNIKFIKVQNTAELNLLRVTNLFRMYR